MQCLTLCSLFMCCSWVINVWPTWIVLLSCLCTFPMQWKIHVDCRSYKWVFCHPKGCIWLNSRYCLDGDNTFLACLETPCVSSGWFRHGGCSAQHALTFRSVTAGFGRLIPLLGDAEDLPEDFWRIKMADLTMKKWWQMASDLDDLGVRIGNLQMEMNMMTKHMNNANGCDAFEDGV